MILNIILIRRFASSVTETNRILFVSPTVPEASPYVAGTIGEQLNKQSEDGTNFMHNFINNFNLYPHAHCGVWEFGV